MIRVILELMQIEPAPREAPQQGKHDVYYEGNKKNELNDLKVYACGDADISRGWCRARS